MKKIRIDCPLCCTTNGFLDIDESIFKCQDCWSKLNLFKLEIKNDGIKRCTFCGNRHFYWERPFSLPLFKRRLTCYVCEAEYIEFKINKDIRKYNEQTFEVIKNSSVYKEWKKYWKEYDPRKEE